MSRAETIALARLHSRCDRDYCNVLQRSAPTECNPWAWLGSIVREESAPTTPANDTAVAELIGESDRHEECSRNFCHVGEIGSGECVRSRFLRPLVVALKAAREDRDLAIAHDRQPYPTPWAYEQACAALHRREREVIDLERKIETIRSILTRVRDSYPNEREGTPSWTVAKFMRESAITCLAAINAAAPEPLSRHPSSVPHGAANAHRCCDVEDIAPELVETARQLYLPTDTSVRRYLRILEGAFDEAVRQMSRNLVTPLGTNDIGDLCRWIAYVSSEQPAPIVGIGICAIGHGELPEPPAPWKAEDEAKAMHPTKGFLVRVYLRFPIETPQRAWVVSTRESDGWMVLESELQRIPEPPSAESGEADDESARYTTDDLDIDERVHELWITPGGNGDWCVAVAPQGTNPTRGVRIVTSGTRVDGLAVAIADAYRAIKAGRRAVIQVPLAEDFCASNPRISDLNAEAERLIDRLNDSDTEIAAKDAEIAKLRAWFTRFLDFAPRVAQLLDGWHADGTAWSEWDETVRKELSESHAAAQELSAESRDHPCETPNTHYHTIISGRNVTVRITLPFDLKQRETGGFEYDIHRAIEVALAPLFDPLPAETGVKS